ncbi:MAG: cysteine--tRNA ligase [Patescibacteria group bacterium]
MFGWFKKKPKTEIQLFNTHGRKKEIFEPMRRGRVSMYNCGPTVYNYTHIGNFRAFLLGDIIRRTLEHAGYRVTQVMNITDFGHLVGDADDTEDKMLVGLKREGLALTMENMFALASKYVDAFKEDAAALNLKVPHAMPRASEHVPGMIAYIQQLLNKGFAYKTSDGVYFDVANFGDYDYFVTSHPDGESRIGAHSEKHDSRDFALWKFAEAGSTMGWEAPWGRGFPGWHIECTAMSTRYLGKSFDIHTGGIDHIAIHHTNERAQAEAANGKQYARYWLHNEFITIDGTKLSKSLGNELTLRQLRDQGVSPLAYRYWLLTGHYRQSMNFTLDAVMAAQTALHRALRFFVDAPLYGNVHREYMHKFDTALNDDLSTPEAISVMWAMIKDDSVPLGDRRATMLAMDEVLGLGFYETATQHMTLVSAVPSHVKELVRARDLAREKKDFAESDRIRAKILDAGYEVLDTAGGSEVRPVDVVH